MNYKLKITTSSLFLTLSFIIGQALHSTAQDKALLWKISGKGLKSPSYLYGTIHLICPDDFIMNDAIRTAVSDAEEIVMELDMDDPEFMTKAQKVSLNPGMANISSKLEDEDKEMLNAFFTKHYGVGLDQFGIMKPFSLLSLILVKSLSCAQPASYEKSFTDMAKEQNKEISGLETIEFQMSIFDDVSFDEQIDWLTEYAGDMESMSAEFDKMVESYVHQDLNGLYKIMIESPQMDGLEEKLLFERNANWIGKIEEKAKEKSTFFAVGAGHLPSDKGVIALLRKKGYEVSPVK